jgi:hypothetical protein
LTSGLLDQAFELVDHCFEQIGLLEERAQRFDWAGEKYDALGLLGDPRQCGRWQSGPH